MKIALAVILFIGAVIFAANVLGSLSGRYGSARRWRNVALAGTIAVAAGVGGVALIVVCC